MEQIHPSTRLIMEWFRAQPLIAVLIIMMILDIVSGMAAAFITKKADSNISRTGAVRKTMVVLLLGMATTIDILTPEVPEGKLVALFFIFTEGLSILENVARCGVPLPAVLVESLSRIKSMSQYTPHYDPHQQGQPLVIEREKVVQETRWVEKDSNGHSQPPAAPPAPAAWDGKTERRLDALEQAQHQQQEEEQQQQQRLLHPMTEAGSHQHSRHGDPITGEGGEASSNSSEGERQKQP